MLIFACGFNGFSQVSTPSAEVNGHSTTAKDFIVTPLFVDNRQLARGNTADLKIPDIKCDSNSIDLRCMETKKSRKESREQHSEDDCTNVLKLKEVVVSWDRIYYVWKNGEVTIMGSPLLCVDARLYTIPNPFQDVRLQSLCTAKQNIFGVDTDGNCMVFGGNNGTVPLQLNRSQEMQCNMDASVVAIFACESGSVILLRDDRHISFGELQGGICLLLNPLNFDLHVKSVSCGKHHILLLSVIGVIFSFGNGGQGQLGHGTITSEAEPRTLEALEGVTIVQVAAGGWHSMALSDIGDIYIWGWNEKGQLGLPCRNLRSPGKDISSESSSLETATPCGTVSEHSSQVYGSTMTIAATAGTVKKSSEETLVNIQPFPVVLDFPLADVCDAFVTKIAAGSRHSVAVFEDGKTFSWGCNDYGQLGHGDTISRDCPELINFFHEQGLSVDNVFSGFWNTVFLTRKSL